VTRHLAKPAAEPAAVVEELRAGGLEAEAVEDVAAATSVAFESARRDGGGVLALGSTYLIAAVRGMLKGTPG
jgi:folylpolyglutamate synthase/dihydropteroate synthase